MQILKIQKKVLSFLKSFSMFNGDKSSLYNIVSSIHVGDKIFQNIYQ